MKALAEIRGLDFSFGGAGPLIMTAMALMGAEVIKVETLRHLDFARTAVEPREGIQKGFDEGGTFNVQNCNKLGIRLDIKKPEGFELAKRLIAMSDIIVVGFAPGVADRIGLSYEAVRQIKPDIIMLSTSGSGSSGPEIGYLGYAPLFAALSGVGDVTGYVDGPPSEIRGTMDIISAFTSVFAVLAALIHRKKTGQGQYIDVASREAMSCLIGDLLMHYTMNGRVMTRNANRDDIMAPHNCYRCRGDDAWISIAIADDKEWRAFGDAIGNPGWTREERFGNQYNRWKNQEELDKLVEGWTINYTPYEVMEILQRAGVAAVPSFTIPELLSDPHLGEREFSTVVDHLKVGSLVVLNSPWKLSLTPPKVMRASPILGQDSEYVFGNILGMPKEEIEALVKEEVIY